MQLATVISNATSTQHATPSRSFASFAKIRGQIKPVTRNPQSAICNQQSATSNRQPATGNQQRTLPPQKSLPLKTFSQKQSYKISKVGESSKKLLTSGKIWEFLLYISCDKFLK